MASTSAPCCKQGLENLLHRRDRLALGEDHLGKAAAAVAVEVDLGLAHVGDGRPLDLADELVDRKLARQQAGRQVVRVS